MGEPVILASRSAIRAELLRKAGLQIEIIPAEVDERALEAQWEPQDLTPAELAERLAAAKALFVSRRHPRRLILGADQTLAVGQERFTKAASRSQALQTLQALQGRRHHLHAGFAFAKNGGMLRHGVSSAALTMRNLSDGSLNAYLDQAGDAVLASVGCYQLEGMGARLFSAIEGDYFTILGLPLVQVLASWRDLSGTGDDL